MPHPLPRLRTWRASARTRIWPGRRTECRQVGPAALPNYGVMMEPLPALPSLPSADLSGLALLPGGFTDPGMFGGFTAGPFSPGFAGFGGFGGMGGFGFG